jgi:hypothetical protein
MPPFSFRIDLFDSAEPASSKMGYRRVAKVDARAADKGSPSGKTKSGSVAVTGGNWLNAGAEPDNLIGTAQPVRSSRAVVRPEVSRLLWFMRKIFTGRHHLHLHRSMKIEEY